MLRGVNKHVVEVVDTGNEYFERAILFIRAELPSRDEQTLRAGAREYLRTVDYVPRKRFSRGRFLLGIGKLAAAAAVGAAAAGFFLR